MIKKVVSSVEPPEYHRVGQYLSALGQNQPRGLTTVFSYLSLTNIYRSRSKVRTRHGATDWFQIGKHVRQGCILSPCLFNFYAEYIMRNIGLEEAQARIKIVGRNINNLRYAGDTTLMAECKEEPRAS